MRRYYALLGALTFSVICTSLYLMTENLTNTSQGLQFEPIKGELSDVDAKIRGMESRLRYNEKVLGIIKDTVLNMTNSKGAEKIFAAIKAGNFEVRSDKVDDKRVIVYPQEMCQLSERPNSKTDIQMLDIFAEIPFDNPDGGAWKQGYPITYDSNQWNTDKLLVFVVPHSHTDPGWIKTHQQYYQEQTRFILDNMLRKLEQYPKMRFVYAEMTYFSMWWYELDSVQKETVKKLLAENRLELLTAGWVMTDEANAHYYAMLDQLIEGNQWLMSETGVRPVSGWAIDPFGHSSTMPYLLKRSGMHNMLIQRVHYSLKKRLSQTKELEFIWRQNWDAGDSTDMLCHLMPFYSYDVPHTCGPEPAICCQFDFKRLPGDRITCPWHVPPQTINSNNVAERAGILLDQYRKKGQLYRNNVVLIPLGDDFRYDTDREWEVQYNNYQQLFDYMNSQPELHVEAKFGTLTDYFNAMRQRAGMSTTEKPKNLPVLAGDFFTYADRDDHYWSGYFTSRPFYKRLDRILEANLRGSEILFSLANAYAHRHSVKNFLSKEVTDALTSVRRQLGLFQHHDAIAGTARDFVVVDYGIRLLNALADTKKMLQQCAHFLLTADKTKYSPSTTYFTLDEVRAAHDSLPEKTTIVVSGEARDVVFFNSLAHTRQALVRLHVSEPHVIVKDEQGRVVSSQMDPYWVTTETISNSIYKLAFVVKIPPVAIVRYTLVKSSADDSPANVLSKSIVYNAKTTVSQGEPFTIESSPLQSFSLDTSALMLEFNGVNGMLKSVVHKASGRHTDVNIKFLYYGAREGKERSGAYLFIPDGIAQDVIAPTPTVRVIRGPLLSEVHVFFSQVQHILRLSEGPGIEGLAVDIQNLVDVSNENNRELVMRLETSVNNKDRTFYADLNGFQMQQRRTLDKLPIQGNFYPMAMGAYLQDDFIRVTLLTGQPLGVASLKTGWLEAIQDRRLMQDDGRGLGQPTIDNKRTPNVFRLVLEPAVTPGQHRELKATGHLSMLSELLSRELLHPVFVFPRRDTGVDTAMSAAYGAFTAELPCELHLVNMRWMPRFNNDIGDTAVILHHAGTDCNYPAARFTCPLSNGEVDGSRVFSDLAPTEVRTSSLSLLDDVDATTSTISVQPMEIIAYKVVLK